MRVGLSVAVISEPQTKPNFAGKWIGGRQMVNPVGVVGPQEMTISQDSSLITIDRPYGKNRALISLSLDGTEKKFVFDLGAPRPGAPSVTREFSSRATWEGNKLKIVSRFRPPGASRDVITVETLSLEGDSLVVERSDEAIGATEAPLRDSTMFQATKLIYKRVSSTWLFWIPLRSGVHRIDASTGAL